MRRQNHIVKFGERVVSGEWLIFEHIQRRSSNPTLAQAADKHLLLHQFTACHVDEVGGGFHQSEVTFPNHAAGVRLKAAVKADEIGFAEDFFQRGDQRDSKSFGLRGVGAGGISQQTHP